MIRTQRDRGAVIPIVALVLPVLILMTAFALDLGRQRSSRRTMQARADIVALDLVRLADGRSEDEIVLGNGVQPSAAAALVDSANRNEVDPLQLTVEWGTWSQTSGFIPTLGSGIPNAVEVTAVETTDYFFRPGTGDVERRAIAIAGEEGTAEFLLGSTLVSMTPSNQHVIGQMLSQIIPGADLVGYGGLANTQVSLADLAVALGAGSTEQMLDSTVTYGELMVATASAMQANGDAAGAAVLNDLVALGVADGSVQMGDVLGASTSEPGTGFAGSVGVPQLLTAMALVADGNHFITIPGSSLNAAGLASVTLDLRGIEPAKRIGILDGAQGTTNQVELGVAIEIDIDADRMQRLCELPSDERTLLGALLGGTFQLLNCLLAPLTEALLEVRIDGDIDLDMVLGAAQARQDIECANDQLSIAYLTESATLAVASALQVSVTFGGSPLDLLGIGAQSSSVPAGGASGTAVFDVLDPGPLHQSFDTGHPPGGNMARAGSPTLGLANILQANNVQVVVANAQLPVLGGIARNLVQPMLNSILAEVDQIVVAEVSRLLGLNLGGADITPQWMRCDDAPVRLVG